MLTRKALVDYAIAFKNPERVPLWVDGDNIGLSDVLTYDLSLPDLSDPTKSEWGFRRARRPDGNWIIPTEPTLAEWKQVDIYKAPPQDIKRRLSRIPMARRVCGDRYRLASLGLSGFAVYCALRGEKNGGVDFLIEMERFKELMDIIMEFETDLFDELARKGFHGIEFCDDWKPSPTSRMKLSTWRVMLRDAYAQQIKRAHDVGLDVWFSVSNECSDYFGDLKQIGAQVVRIEDPIQMEVSSIGRIYHGRLCFATRVDELNETPDLNHAIREVRECLGALTGGFIATVGAHVPLEKIREIYEITKDPALSPIRN